MAPSRSGEARWVSDQIHRLTLHKRAGTAFEHVPFVAAYAAVAFRIYATFGDPYREALELYGRTEPAEDAVDGFLPPCRELPSEWAPSFTSRLLLAALICLHVLMLLMQRWSVSFRARLRFRPATLSDATHAVVTPPAHHGKSALVEIHGVGGRRPYFFFQKFKYIWERGDDVSGGGGGGSGDGSGDGSGGSSTGAAAFRAVECPDRLPLGAYTTYGLSNERAYTLLKRHGRNVFKIELPSFKDLYIQGILKPFSVFQFFCIMLWCLDEYWQYSLFTLFMMFVFEGTVVMSRRKNLQTLRGMNNAPRRLLVRRGGQWHLRTAEDLVPGDVLSLTRGRDEDVIPCDCLLLRGKCVVNEAILTGESVPQMKEGLVVDVDTAHTPLDVDGVHKTAVLWGGTRVLQNTGCAVEGQQVCSEDEGEAGSGGGDGSFGDGGEESWGAGGRGSAPDGAPDGGCLVWVLRTGFASSQGKMVRLIEFSSDQVSGNTKEAALLVLFLLFFALAASGYVLHHGLEDGRDQFDLLLHCILIITSVIPPELNMQMALAVNTSLLALIKAHIFCTEPYRIPLAGTIDTCLFDKTGTITTDELVASGVVAWEAKKASKVTAATAAAAAAAAPDEMPMKYAPPITAVVAGACHSLVEIEGKVQGDPLELAALRGCRWTYNVAANVARPRPPKTKSAKDSKSSSSAAAAALTSSGVHKNTATAATTATTAAITKTRPPASSDIEASILHRHHFHSRLQRMSVVARVRMGRGARPQRYALVKGSPEVIFAALDKTDATACPPWYESAHKALAQKGMRVIATAYKCLDEGASDAQLCDMPRAEIESGLKFAGFLTFRCLLRKDSRAVVQVLKAGSSRVAMATGDAILTAIHVAGEVNITTTDRNKVLVLEERSSGDGGDGGLFWRNLGTNAVDLPYAAAGMPKLAGSGFDLCMTGTMLTAAAEQDSDTWRHLECVRVFARMTPERKERVLMALKDMGRSTIMCGDGANDVGALKQAHVGIALLSGFKNANVVKDDKRAPAAPTTNTANNPAVAGANSNAPAATTNTAAAAAEDASALATLKQTPEERAKIARAEAMSMMKDRQAEIQRKFKETAERDGIFAAFKVMMAENKKLQVEARAKMGQVGSVTGSASFMAAQDMEDMEDMGGVPMVKLGDASVAAPFTSKLPSIGAAVDIIRQGRCTLVSTIQMYQILALNCLISSYSLSRLYLDGVKFGDRQMTGMGILMTVSSLSVSRAQPQRELSSVRPLSSIFHPALFVSLLGQFAVHLGTMMYARAMTQPYLPDDYVPNPESKFEPNLVNSVIFLVTCVQQTVVFVVNYKGLPFMNGITENSALLYSLLLCGVGAFVCASNALPMFNKLMQLVEYPSEGFRQQITLLLAFNVVATFVIDRLCLALFAPDILRASLKDVTWRDAWGMARKLALCVGIVYMFAVDPDEIEAAMAEYETEA